MDDGKKRHQRAAGGSREACLDARTAARAARLRRIGGLEIARHREKRGLIGAALDGSLATGALWPTSDLDFTVVPLAEEERQLGVEWGQREGIVWHKHLTGRQILLDLMNRYPDSFVRLADREFSLDANWFLDGLAVMEVAEDPEGLLAETKAFVGGRRFAPPVWEGRREALLHELRRQRDAARAALEGGEAGKACEQLSRPTGLAMVAGQLWIEAARRMYSGKEQDGLLAEVSREAGYPEVHALYHAVIGVQPGRAEAAAPLVRELGKCGEEFYHRMASIPRAYRKQHGRLPVWAAWIRHLAAKLALAPFKGHPAYLYQQREALLYWTMNSPARAVEELREKGAPGVEELAGNLDRATVLAAKLDDTLFGSEPVAERASVPLAAAERLVELTGKWV